MNSRESNDRFENLRDPKETNPGREARIAELRRQYRDGTYKVDAQKLSVKLVEHMRG